MSANLELLFLIRSERIYGVIKQKLGCKTNMQHHLLLPQRRLTEVFQVALLLKCAGEADLCATCDAHKKRRKPEHI